MHNPNLFAVMSEVKGKDWLGRERVYKNFVAECETQAQAEGIISQLERT